MAVRSYPWEIGSLPFVFKPLPEPTNGGDIPDFLPFSLDVDENTGTLIQSKNEYVEQILSKAYAKGSEISGMMDDHGIGELYAQDFIRFLTEQFHRETFEKLKILEIGCGTGYLLSQLKLRGAEVLGIEPGDQGQEGARRFNIPVIQDFFPSPKISGKFDIIILYGVLEHISSPESFLRNVLIYLENEGHIVISVPNCEPYIEVGDVSFLLHEHWNYYTEETLKASIAKMISINVEIKKSNFGGTLYAIGSLSPLPLEKDNIDVEKSSKFSEKRADKFQILVKKNTLTISNYLDSAAKLNGDIGIFVPGRAINLLSLIDSKIGRVKIRFFDDNANLYKTYYPGFNNPVESRQDLFKNPPKILIIFSHSFGEKIKNELKDTLKNTQIIIWNDIFKVR